MSKKKESAIEEESEATVYEFDKADVDGGEEVTIESAKDASSEEYDALSAKYIRLQADFDNFKRRNADQGARMYQEGKFEVIEGILPVLDNLDMAISAQKDEGQRQGIELVRKQFLDVMAKFGVEEYDPAGEEFSPHLHEAVMSKDDPDNVGKIVAVLKKGYKHSGKVLRHPMVIVGK